MLKISLDSELNSEALNQLHQQPISIAERLDQFVRTLQLIHEKDEVIHAWSYSKASLTSYNLTADDDDQN
ncbi:hypothetical protein KEM48_006445 [Puccinia striiformis f. sp. tritici PST-130]|nr:hypothetical protein KEM48_006445 [Puccinia striiformis f. sp. tritici PST-130]